MFIVKFCNRFIKLKFFVGFDENQNYLPLFLKVFKKQFVAVTSQNGFLRKKSQLSLTLTIIEKRVFCF